MSTAELKINTINKMEKGVFQLTEAQRKRILEAKNDLVLTEEQANKGIEEWLEER